MIANVLQTDRTSTPDFGSRLREERKRFGLTQARLAALVGISAPTQIGYENNTRTPDASYVTAIEKHGLDEHYIRTGVRRRRAAVDDMDWEFFLAVQSAGQVWFKEELGIALDPRESNEIARLLYELMIDQHQIEVSTITRVLRLVTSRK